MIIFQRLISGSVLSAAAATYYTAPANTKAVIQHMALANTTTNAVSATVHVVGTGASESVSTAVISSRVISGLETYNCPEAIGAVILATGTIRALAGAVSTISIQASGIEIA